MYQRNQIKLTLETTISLDSLRCINFDFNQSSHKTADIEFSDDETELKPQERFYCIDGTRFNDFTVLM